MNSKNRKIMNSAISAFKNVPINEGGKTVAGGSTWKITNWGDTFEIKSVNDTADFDIDDLDDLIKGLIKLKKINK
jgi:hypothetical protein